MPISKGAAKASLIGLYLNSRWKVKEEQEEQEETDGQEEKEEE